MSVEVQSLEVIVHPENVAAAFQRNEANLFAIWMCLNAVDRASCRDGRFRLDSTYLMIQKVTGVKRAQAYALFKKGVGVYWSDTYRASKPTADGKVDKFVLLRSLKHVVAHLQPNMTRSHALSVPISEFAGDDGGFTPVKRMLMDIVIGRNTSPISRAQMTAALNVSMTTVKRCLRESPRLHKQTNFAVLHRGKDEQDARSVANRLRIASGGKRAYRVGLADGAYHVFQQLPNTFFLNDWDRLPISQRPRELRAFDSEVTARCKPRIYDNGFHRSTITGPALSFKPTMTSARQRYEHNKRWQARDMELQK